MKCFCSSSFSCIPNVPTFGIAVNPAFRIPFIFQGVTRPCWSCATQLCSGLRWKSRLNQPSSRDCADRGGADANADDIAARWETSNRRTLDKWETSFSDGTNMKTYPSYHAGACGGAPRPGHSHHRPLSPRDTRQPLYKDTTTHIGILAGDHGEIGAFQRRDGRLGLRPPVIHPTGAFGGRQFNHLHTKGFTLDVH